MSTSMPYSPSHRHRSRSSEGERVHLDARATPRPRAPPARRPRPRRPRTSAARRRRAITRSSPPSRRTVTSPSPASTMRTSAARKSSRMPPPASPTGVAYCVSMRQRPSSANESAGWSAGNAKSPSPARYGAGSREVHVLRRPEERLARSSCRPRGWRPRPRSRAGSADGRVGVHEQLADELLGGGVVALAERDVPHGARRRRSGSAPASSGCGSSSRSRGCCRARPGR